MRLSSSRSSGSRSTGARSAHSPPRGRRARRREFGDGRQLGFGPISSRRAGTHGVRRRVRTRTPRRARGERSRVQLPDAERALCPRAETVSPIGAPVEKQEEIRDALAWRRRSFPGPRRAARRRSAARRGHRRRTTPAAASAPGRSSRPICGTYVSSDAAPWSSSTHARISDRAREGPTIAISPMPESARASSTWQTIGRLATRCAVIAHDSTWRSRASGRRRRQLLCNAWTYNARDPGSLAG